MSQEERATPSGIFHFGLLRLFLALSVVVWHITAVAPIGGEGPTATRYGIIAVFIFFIISGLVITEATKRNYLMRAWSYLANRVTRLWPPYLLTLVVTFSVLALPVAGEPLGEGVLSTRNVLANVFSLFPTTPVIDALIGARDRIDAIGLIWSVRVEFAFYLVIFVCLLAPQALATGRLVLALLTGAICAHLLLVYGFTIGRIGDYAIHAPFFVAGVGLSFYIRASGGDRWAYGVVTSIALALGALVATTFPDYPSVETLARALGNGRWSGGVLFIALLGVFALHFAYPHAWLGAKADRISGDLSYPLYLSHYAAIFAVKKWLPDSLWNIPLVLVTSVLLAALLMIISDKMLDGTREKLRGKPRIS